MNGPGTACTFGPHIATVCTGPHAAPWYSVFSTETPLWVFLALIWSWLLIYVSASWLKDRYSLAGRRLVRRWYGTGCRVQPSAEGMQQGLYQFVALTVEAWDEPRAGSVWVRVCPRWPREDACSRWVRASALVPFEYPVLRPRLRQIARHSYRLRVRAWRYFGTGGGRP